jgi:hypothetical protein
MSLEEYPVEASELPDGIDQPLSFAGSSQLLLNADYRWTAASVETALWMK